MLRWLLLLVHAPYLVGLRWIIRALTNRLAFDRGMSIWYDMKDWVGGYPFEVSHPEGLFRFFRDRGFRLYELKTCGGSHGCIELLFINEI